MKSKSILFVTALAILAIAAGCTGQSIPEVPTGGVITPIEDTLEGQLLDASKFEVTANYMNSASKTFPNAAIFDEDSDGIAENGDVIYAVIGKDLKGNEILAKGQLTTYMINKLFVDDGPATITYSNGSYDVTVADFSVSADYVKKGAVQAPIALGTSEYRIANIIGEAPTVGNPSNVTVMIQSNLVNNSTAIVEYEVEAVIPDAVTELPEGTEVTSIAVTYSGVLPALDYGDAAPAVDMSQVQVLANGKYDITAASEVAWTDVNGLDLLDYNFIGEDTVGLTVKYGDFTKTARVPVREVAVTIRPAGFESAALVPGADIVIDAADFVVDYACNSEYGRVNGDDESVELVFGAVASEVTPTNGYVDITYVTDITDGKVPAAGSQVAVYAKYMGQASGTAYVIGTSADAATITIDNVELDPDFVIYKQVYTEDINETLTTDVIVSINGTQDNKDIEIDPAEVKVAYSTSNANFTALENGHYLSETDELYVWITYEYGSNQSAAYAAPVTVADAVVTDVELVADYQYTTEAGEPMLNSDITWSLVYYSADGIINTVDEDSISDAGTVWVNGKTGALPTDVTDEEAVVSVVLSDGETDPVTVPAGLGYVAPVTAIKVELSAEYKAMVDDLVAEIPDSAFAITEGTWKFEGTGAAAPVISNIVPDFSRQIVVTGNANTVTAMVSYLGEDGIMHNDPITVTFTGTDWTEADSIKLVNSARSEIAEGTTYADGTYTYVYDEFGASGDSHDVDSMLAVVGWCNGTWDNDPASLSQANIPGTLDLNAIKTFVIRYTDGDGNVAYKTFQLTNVAVPTN